MSEQTLNTAYPLAWELPGVRCTNCGYPSFDGPYDAGDTEGECFRCYCARYAYEYGQERLGGFRDDLLSVLRQLSEPKRREERA